MSLASLFWSVSLASDDEPVEALAFVETVDELIPNAAASALFRLPKKVLKFGLLKGCTLFGRSEICSGTAVSLKLLPCTSPLNC